jgi:hypothetical protein
MEIFMNKYDLKQLRTFRKEIVVNSVATPTAIKLITPYEHGVSFLKLVSVQNG